MSHSVKLSGSIMNHKETVLITQEIPKQKHYTQRRQVLVQSFRWLFQQGGNATSFIMEEAK